MAAISGTWANSSPGRAAPSAATFAPDAIATRARLGGEKDLEGPHGWFPGQVDLDEEPGGAGGAVEATKHKAAAPS